MSAPGEPAIVLFDGVCNFCSEGVRFLAPRDPAGRLHYAALQSEAGRRLQRRFGLDPADLDTVVLVEGDRCHLKSGAIVRVLRRLRGAWPLLAALLWLVPSPLRDAAYVRFARNRYRWFGKSDACLVPTPELRARFLD